MLLNFDGDLETKFTCCICDNIFQGYGNNPEPISDDEDGVCCDNCNGMYVIPLRMLKGY